MSSQRSETGLFQRQSSLLGWWLATGLIALGLLLSNGCQPREASSRPPLADPASGKSASSPAGNLRVVAAHAFLADAVTSLGGERIELLTLVPVGLDPAAWKPTAADLQQMQHVDLIVLNGASYEPWVASVALPSTRMLRTANAFREQWIETEGVIHSHGPGGEHSHAGTASTTWLDLELAQAQVTAIRDRLKELLPDEAQQIDSRCAAYLAQLQQLDQRMQQLAGQIGTRPMVVSHPVFQYWGRRYQLNLRSVHWEPTESPGEAGWAELEELLKEFPATLFVWEATPSTENQAALAARGFTSVMFTPGGSLNGERTWREEMQANLDRLEQALSQGP